MHYGFSVKLTESFLSDITRSISKSDLTKASQGVEELYTKFVRAFGANYHLMFAIKEHFNQLSIRSLVPVHVGYMTLEGDTWDKTWASQITKDNMFDSFFTESFGKDGIYDDFLDYKQITADIFVAFWERADRNEHMKEYVERFKPDEVVPITIVMSRPEYGTERAHYSQGGPFFFLGGGFKMLDEAGNMMAEGYSEDYHDRENYGSPDRLKTEWSVYKVGYRRIDEFYPDVRSLFISHNKNPFNGVIKPEVDVSYGIRMTVRTSAHNFALLRHKGKEYFTLEGRPCYKVGNNRNKLSCTLPMVNRRESIKDIIEYVSDILMLQGYEYEKRNNKKLK